MSAPEVRIGDGDEGMEDAQADIAMGGDGAGDAEVDEALEVLREQEEETSAATSKPRFVEYGHAASQRLCSTDHDLATSDPPSSRLLSALVMI
jgi:hypothetical protein